MNIVSLIIKIPLYAYKQHHTFKVAQEKLHRVTTTVLCAIWFRCTLTFEAKINLDPSYLSG